MSSHPSPTHTTLTAGDGVTLAVFDHDAGASPGRPVVVAVHGYPDDHTMWDGVVADLGRDHHVLTYDVRGAGGSTAPADRSGYALDQLVDDLRRVVDHAAPGRRVHLLAHDWGSIQCWHAVTGELGARVASFTSISGPSLHNAALWLRGTALGPARPRRRDRIRQLRSSWYIGLFRAPLLPELAWRSGVAAAVVHRLEGVPRPRTTDAIHGLELYRQNIGRLGVAGPRRTAVPVQVLAPTKDRYVTVPLQTEIEGVADDLAVRRLPGGHWIPRSRPDVVARCVRELVARVEAENPTPDPPAHAPANPTPDDPPARASAQPQHDGMVRAIAPSLLRARRGPGRGRWSDRIVVVTGAGSGIGRATALAFARRGAHVVAADRDPETAARTADLARAAGSCAWPYEVDVAEGAAVERLAAWVAEQAGVPDVVVNNAGIGLAGPFTATTPQDWQRIVDVNLWGVIHGSRVFAAQLRAHGEGGQIVNVASAAAYTPTSVLGAYSTTKAAVLMLSECLRAELAADGIGVTAVCPGFVRTGITTTTRFAGADPETERQRRERATALYARRNYSPERVAERVVHAVEHDVALAPVTPEAHVTLLMSRLTPGLLRALARQRGSGGRR